MPNAQQAFDQKIDEMIVSLLACRGWGKRKQKAKSELLDYLASCGYIHFPGTYRQFFGIRCVGEQKVLDLPPTRKGVLSVFKGKRVRIICVGSGRSFLREYVAGQTSRSQSDLYNDVVKFWINEKNE
jgi:hypothetical protein